MWKVQSSIAMLAAVSMVAAGCVKTPTATHAAKKPTTQADVLTSAATRLVAQSGQTLALTGKVKLISDNGGALVSDNGGALVSDNGGGVISNNSGNIIANNAGSIIANNSGGLVGKTRLHLLQAEATAHEFALADAQITFTDATGATLVDEHGKPLGATTDAQGNYKLSAVLPAGNVIMHVQLASTGLLKGGSLTAMLPQGTGIAREQAIDTATSLGAAYVLGKFVNGSQKTFDKLPASEATRLENDLEDAQSLLKKAPGYQTADLLAAADDLRGAAPAVGQELDTIKALLLGQADLGDGHAATQVALQDITGLIPKPDGSLYLGESFFGRVRAIDANGRLTTYADVVHGQVKQNFPAMSDLAAGPDGSLYAAAGGKVFRIDPGGTVTTFAGGSGLSADLTGSATTLHTGKLAVGADGTVYVGEQLISPGKDGAGRLLAFKADGTSTELALPDGSPPGTFQAVAVGPDGSVYALFTDYAAIPGEVLRWTPDGKASRFFDGVGMDAQGGGLAIAPDNTVYVSQATDDRVTAIAPDGSHQVVAGHDGPANTQLLVKPHGLAIDAKGDLLIADTGRELVYSLGKDGSFKVLAGTRDPNFSSGNLREVSFDAPSSATFDAAGRLVVAEAGSGLVRRIDGQTISTLAGGGSSATLSGPATGAVLYGLNGITYKPNGTLLAFAGGCLVAVDPSGQLSPLVGGNPDYGLSVNASHDVDVDARTPADTFSVAGVSPRVGPDGLVYWINGRRQIMRLAADGQVEVVAGKAVQTGAQSGGTNVAGFAGLSGADGQAPKEATFVSLHDLAFGPNGDLYYSDMGSFQIGKIAHLTDGGTPVVQTVAGLPTIQALAQSDPTLLNDTADAKGAVLIMPFGLAVDAAGNVYFSELGTTALPLLTPLAGDAAVATQGLPVTYARVRKVTPDGHLTTIAGNGGKFFPDPSQDDGLSLPVSLSVSPTGQLAIVDAGANLLRILPAGSY